jgi:hypothetical protein
MVGLVQFSSKVVDARIDARCINSKLVFAEFPASRFKFRYLFRQQQTRPCVLLTRFWMFG